MLSRTYKCPVHTTSAFLYLFLVICSLHLERIYSGSDYRLWKKQTGKILILPFTVGWEQKNYWQNQKYFRFSPLVKSRITIYPFLFVIICTLILRRLSPNLKCICPKISTKKQIQWSLWYKQFFHIMLKIAYPIDLMRFAFVCLFLILCTSYFERIS